MGENITKLHGKRIRLTAVIVTVLWILFGIRFWQIQILYHEELSLAAENQYAVPVKGMNFGNQILDRNLQPLTGGVKQYFYFIKKSAEDAELAALLAAVSAEIQPQSNQSEDGYTVYRTNFYDETIHETLRNRYHAYAVCGQSRYSDAQTACHLIEHLDREKEGDENPFLLYASGDGALLQGKKPEWDAGDYMERANLVLTVDRDLQIFCEEEMKAGALEGALLISHAATGEILAWVSSPAFNLNQPEGQREGDASDDKCLRSEYAPGALSEIAGTESETVSPFQLHGNMAAVVSGGIREPLNAIYGEITDLSGDGENQAKRVFTEMQAEEIMQHLCGVLAMEGGPSWPCMAGGMAADWPGETDSEDVPCCWFSGFCQVEEEWYAVTVLAENRFSGWETCLPVFRQVCDYLVLRGGIDGTDFNGKKDSTQLSFR